MMRAIFFSVALLLAGCSGVEAVPACEADADCGFGDMCVSGSCAAVGCTSSSDCALGDHCSAERRCEAGCAADTDCGAGEICDGTGACVSQRCSDTRTDCGWGEVCSGDGECVPAEGIYCDTCATDDDCPGGACWNDWCGPSCEVRDDCAAGFDCIDIGPEGAPERICLSDCWGH